MSGGILIGLGFTSQKGKTFRKQIIDKGDEYLSQILDKLTLISNGTSESLKELDKEVKAVK